jgi:hypothetical protein
MLLEEEERRGKKESEPSTLEKMPPLRRKKEKKAPSRLNTKERKREDFRAHVRFFLVSRHGRSRVRCVIAKRFLSVVSVWYACFKIQFFEEKSSHTQKINRKITRA